MNLEEEIVKSLISLNQQQATILFWKMRGLNDELVGQKFGWHEPWTEKQMKPIYEDLGFEAGQNNREKKRILYTDYLPILKLITDDDPENLENWPHKVVPFSKPIDIV